MKSKLGSFTGIRVPSENVTSSRSRKFTSDPLASFTWLSTHQQLPWMQQESSIISGNSHTNFHSFRCHKTWLQPLHYVEESHFKMHWGPMQYSDRRWLNLLSSFKSHRFSSTTSTKSRIWIWLTVTCYHVLHPQVHQRFFLMSLQGLQDGNTLVFSHRFESFDSLSPSHSDDPTRKLFHIRKSTTMEP